jgi:hypothetical protein
MTSRHSGREVENMEQAARNIAEEVSRGEILLYLRKLYPHGATPLMLIHYLDAERGILVDEQKFAFHVHYLAEAGLVAYETFPKRAGEPERIRLVKITKGGIDEADGRPGNSSGVRL